MSPTTSASNNFSRIGLLLGAVAVPVSLAWDFSWESTVGLDRVWAPPHTAVYVAIFVVAMAALLSVRSGEGVRIWRWHVPLGACMSLWGALAFAVGFTFDRWWQSSYGLAAGIWHPPQILNSAAFIAIALGAWLSAVRVDRRGVAFLLAGGALLALITVFSITGVYANRQHSAPFYLLACATYPLVLVTLAVVGKPRYSATLGALIYLVLLSALVWVLPLVPGSPQVAPVYHPRSTLLPLPFPLLLFIPAIAIDLMLRVFPGRRAGWGAAIETGLAFWLIFGVVQWTFAKFLLSSAADHWLFAGGGRHWPFFLKIQASAQTAFWNVPGDEFTLVRALIAAALAVIAARLGLWLATWMGRLQR